MQSQHSHFHAFTFFIMPRENRKRGKKHKKSTQDAEFDEQEHTGDKVELEPEAGPSWIVANPQQEQVDSEAPFGYLDADVKAYFRTVDVQIRQWQDGQVEVDEDGESKRTAKEKAAHFSCQKNIHSSLQPLPK